MPPVSSPVSADIPQQRWPLGATALIICLCWLALAWPWLSGAVTIPWDAKAHFQPQLQALASALHEGRSPFWTSYVFAGHPQVADPQSLIFSPPFLLLAALSPAPSFAAMDGVLLAMLLAGGLALMLMFRDRNWHPAGAIVAALAFAFGAAAAWRIQHVGQVMSLAWLAMSWLCLSRALDRNSLGWGLLAGLFAGQMVLGRDQVALLGLYLLSAHVAVWWLTSPQIGRDLVRSLKPLTAGALAGVAMAALPILLTWLIAGQSNRPAIDLEGAGRGSLHPFALLTGVAANLYGAAGPLVNHWGPPSPTWGPVDLYLARNMSVVYAGALPLLALLSAGIWRGALLGREGRFLAGALLVCLAYALGRYTPAFTLLFDWLPGASFYRRPADAVFVLGLLVAMAGGYLVHRLASDDLPPAKLWQRAGFALSVLFLLGACAAVAWWKGALMLASPALGVSAASLALALGVMLGLPALKRRPPLAAMLLVAAAMTIDLSVSNGPSESTALPPSEYDVLRPATANETIARLKAEVRRTAGPDRRDRVELAGIGFHWPNASLVHRFDNVLGYNPLRLGHYSAATGAEDHVALPDQRRFSALMPGYRSLLADMLGLRFIATGVPAEQIDRRLKPGDLTLIARTPDAFIYENPRALPRVLVVGEARRSDASAIIASGKWPAEFGAAEFDPRRMVLVERDAPLPPTPGGRPPGTAAILDYGTDTVTVEALSPQGGFLVLNDVWQDWWRAEVNGAPAELLRANAIFRAVAVPEGRSTVTFRFDPWRGALAGLESRFRPAGGAAVRPPIPLPSASAPSAR
jgi:hypothetical protein